MSDFRKKILTDDDKNLFKQSVGKVTAIKSEAHFTFNHKPKPRPIPKKWQLDAEPTFESLLHRPTETVFAEDVLSFLDNPSAPKLLKQLRRGEFPIEAHLDLHGLTIIGAKQRLTHFLQYCEDKDYRCVRIVHGKGYRSVHNHPVLKNELNYWLRHCATVQAFCSAPSREGGTGALWVLLHKKNSAANSVKRGH
ncbi:MAG: hypothetical protein RL637_713 [Pseudomonadota bacterium]|jgi:DNA-nicking Smr family endonuclease